MYFLIFLKYLIKNYPTYIGAIIFVLLIGGLVETGALLAIAPIIDIITNPEAASVITKKIEEIILTWGFQFNLWMLLFLYFTITLVKSLFDVFAMYLILSMKYKLVKEIIINTHQSIFSARWYFFIKEKQGKLLNTFMREIKGLGDCSAGAGRLFANVLKLIIYVAVTFYISWEVSLIGYAFTLLVVTPLLSLGKITYKFGKKSST